ncbi:hypothetical protein GCM10020218_093000 [Dactylosporangium vinaceum]
MPQQQRTHRPGLADRHVGRDRRLHQRRRGRPPGRPPARLQRVERDRLDQPVDRHQIAGRADEVIAAQLQGGGVQAGGALDKRPELGPDLLRDGGRQRCAQEDPDRNVLGRQAGQQPQQRDRPRAGGAQVVERRSPGRRGRQQPGALPAQQLQVAGQGAAGPGHERGRLGQGQREAAQPPRDRLRGPGVELAGLVQQELRRHVGAQAVDGQRPAGWPPAVPGGDEDVAGALRRQPAPDRGVVPGAVEDQQPAPALPGEGGVHAGDRVGALPDARRVEPLGQLVELRQERGGLGGAEHPDERVLVEVAVGVLQGGRRLAHAAGPAQHDCGPLGDAAQELLPAHHRHRPRIEAQRLPGGHPPPIQQRADRHPTVIGHHIARTWSRQYAGNGQTRSVPGGVGNPVVSGAPMWLAATREPDAGPATRASCSSSRSAAAAAGSPARHPAPWWRRATSAHR